MRRLVALLQVLWTFGASSNSQEKGIIRGGGCELNFLEINLTISCQPAIFGGFVTESAKFSRKTSVVVAEPSNACSALNTACDHQKQDIPTIFVVQRGECSFTDKLLHVEESCGAFIVLINNDNSLFTMQTVEWIDSSVVALSIRKDDGVRLLNSVSSTTLMTFWMSHTQSVLSQCLERIEILLGINAPRAAVDTFLQCAPHFSFPTSHFEAIPAPNEEFAQFYSRSSTLFHELIPHYRDILQRMLFASTYWAVQYIYWQAIFKPLVSIFFNPIPLDQVQLKHFAGQPWRHFSMEIMLKRKTYLHGFSGLQLYGVYKVAIDNIEKLFKNPVNSSNMECLQEATDRSLRVKSNTCCIAVAAESGVALHYTNSYVRFLYQTFTQMGVFLDELGAYEASISHFKHGLAMCGKATSLHVRIGLAIPTVFQSSEDMRHELAQYTSRIDQIDMHELEVQLQQFVRPEVASHLQWTITPPTMFVGYQGTDPLQIQIKLAAMYHTIYPSLKTSFPLSRRHQERKIKIGFISSWFRSHSVGKLIKGVLQTLERSKFIIVVIAAQYFFRADHTMDLVTKEIYDAADNFLRLPKSQQRAMEVVIAEDLDVLVYPEIGMDSWMYFFAHHRLAPVQCVFWGHPITTGLSTIDYFIASEYFFSDFFEGGHGDDSYGGMSYIEQMVLFSDLSTFFVKPQIPPIAPLRSNFHLPMTGRIYICPQTLMKMHMDFDNVLRDILTQDTNGYIVALYSVHQALWKERLLQRFDATLGLSLSRRIIFLQTMPYDQFMQLLSVADVMLDPFPFGGGVTTLDAFALGLPVITLPSRQTVVQLAAGFYRYINFTSCIAKNLDDYVATAVAVAKNSTFREGIRRAILNAHDIIYSSDASNDWNTFLANVSPIDDME
ncbi:hypothetical protein Ae201684_012348 [Aphanomyces euteiches]|uniref:O-GlcNAc transferase C-terminal domain-containing protein n=1 Tax=Aphanomyces euteiches TaxID=100861 RepID=A0A6G0WSD3_9STRA|nr:hypothetical protein Ae201684_012348 [Aphanomyces euteiches]